MTIMTNDRPKDNPFDLTKASDYSDRQVKDFWVDMAGGHASLVDYIKPKSKMSMFLLGGKGSGKTHLMRYLSSSVQALRFGDDLRKGICQDRYLAAYTNADGLNVHRFRGKGQSEEVWESIFAYSFELFLASAFMESLRPALLNRELSDAGWQKSFSTSVEALFNSRLAEPIASFDALLEYIAARRRGVDLIVNNLALTRRLEGIEINFNPGDLIFGLPKIIGESCGFAKDALILYLIDEIENFTPQQQRFLNTLVRYRRGNVSFRIGSRLYGIKTYETLGSGEPIKAEAEFEFIYLDRSLRESQGQYDTLAVNLILKRLEAAGLLTASIAEDLPTHFDELNSADYYKETALALTADRDAAGKERPHIARLRKHAERAFGDKKIVEKLIEFLAVPQHPLLEKVNILIFYKRLSRQSNLLEVAEEISAEMVKLVVGGPSAAPDYYETYSHFSSDLLAQLARDYSRKPHYAGLKSLVRISQGVPRNLLSLLKHIYTRSVFLGEAPFEVGSRISVEAQMQGIADAASWFLEDAQPDSNGPVVRAAVDNLATLLRAIRYSDNPAECDLSSFRLNVSELSEAAAGVLRMAENWSYLLRVNGGKNAKNDDRVLTHFQVNPMLAAKWGISEVRRGVLEMKPTMANTLLTSIDSQVTQREINERVDGMNLPKILEQVIFGVVNSKQSRLFDA